MKTFKQIFLESFCEREYGSAKRMIGFIAMIFALICIGYLTVVEGCSECVEGLLQTIIISSCALLGVSSITGIWKNGRTSINDNKEQENEQ